MRTAAALLDIDVVRFCVRFCDSISYVRGTCDGKSGTFGAMELIQNHVEVIIGPACGHGK